MLLRWSCVVCIGPVESVNNDGDTTIIHIPDTSNEIQALFANKNIITLQQLSGSDVLLDVCMDLVYLKRYMMRYQDAVKGDDYLMPGCVSEAMGVRTR